MLAIAAGCTDSGTEAGRAFSKSSGLLDYRSVTAMAEYSFTDPRSLSSVLSQVDAVVVGNVTRVWNSESSGQPFRGETVTVEEILFAREQEPPKTLTFEWPVFSDGERTVTFGGARLPSAGDEVLVLLRYLGESEWTQFNTQARATLNGDGVATSDLPSISGRVAQLRREIADLTTGSEVADSRPPLGAPEDAVASGSGVTVLAPNTRDSLALLPTETGFCYEVSTGGRACFPRYGGLGPHEILMEQTADSLFVVTGAAVEEVALNWSTPTGTQSDRLALRSVELEGGVVLRVGAVKRRSNFLPSASEVRIESIGDEQTEWRTASLTDLDLSYSVTQPNRLCLAVSGQEQSALCLNNDVVTTLLEGGQVATRWLNGGLAVGLCSCTDVLIALPDGTQTVRSATRLDVNIEGLPRGIEAFSYRLEGGASQEVTFEARQ